MSGIARKTNWVSFSDTKLLHPNPYTLKYFNKYFRPENVFDDFLRAINLAK